MQISRRRDSLRSSLNSSSGCSFVMSPSSTTTQAIIAAAPLTVGRLPDELLAAWIASLHDPDARNDLRAVMQGISLLRGDSRDRLFPVGDAERLVRTLPRARLELIDDACTYDQIDRPQRLAELIGGLLASN